MASLLQISGVRDTLREIRQDIREIRSNIKILAGKVADIGNHLPLIEHRCGPRSMLDRLDFPTT
jgi:hypothetical protein